MRVALLLVLGVVWIVLRQRAQTVHPEKFAGTPEGDAIKAQIPADPRKRRTQIIVACVVIAVVVIAAIFGINALLGWLDQL